MATHGSGDRVTEAELNRIWVTPVPRVDGTIFLADYDPAWPALYEREATRVRSLLGKRVRRLEHIGSTSVPGLAAKPQIDIVLVVDDSADEGAYLPALEAAGYTLVIREPELHEHRVCKGPDTNINLHIHAVGDVEADRMVRFRDRLRTHPEEFASYLATKRELAARNWEFVQQYADAKSDVVESILARADADAAR